jgi:hypothetical protein
MGPATSPTSDQGMTATPAADAAYILPILESFQSKLLAERQPMEDSLKLMEQLMKITGTDRIDKIRMIPKIREIQTQPVKPRKATCRRKKEESAPRRALPTRLSSIQKRRKI